MLGLVSSVHFLLPFLLLLLPEMASIIKSLPKTTAETTTTSIANAIQLSICNDSNIKKKKCNDYHRFDGIGGLSAGATSRLLVEYPEEVRSEILDFLFQPNFGASLHMIKVEIGGDAQSTDGSESTHMHSKDDLNWNRGYEWWILKEAKKRNPDIITYGLPWAWPGWLSEKNKHGPFQNIDLATNYTLQWVKGAREMHGIEIDYLGIWNEIGTSREYLLALRKVLDDNGFPNIKLVSNDGNPKGILPNLVNDTDYIDAIDVLGFHYPRDDDAESWALANSFGKPIWAAEESSSYDDLNGASCWARVMASHFVLNNMTSSIMWSLVGSYSHGTNWYGASMLTAVQPWTGYYEWEQMPVVWATAHYTQFIRPGWYFLPVGQGSGELSFGGYYLTLVSPDLRHFTLIVVKISRDHASCTRPRLWDWETKDEMFNIVVRLPKPLVGKPPNSQEQRDAGTSTQTWYSNLEQEKTRLFEKLDSVSNNGLSEITRTTDETTGGRSFEILLNVSTGSLFTVTNQADHVGHKGTTNFRKKSDSFFPLPYHDDFDDYDCNNCYSKYLADQMGAFEIQFVGDTPINNNNVDEAMNNTFGQQRRRRTLVQMTPELPVMWWQEQRDRGPVTIIGMTEWEDVMVETSFLLPDKASAACVSTRTDQYWERGVSLCANTTQWFLLYGGANLKGYDPSIDNNAIAHGYHEIETDEWHTMSLSTLDHQARCRVNDALVVPNASIRVGDSGFVALGTSKYAPVRFGHIHIEPIGSQWSKPLPSAVTKRDEDSSPSSSWSLSFRACTPNGYSKESEQFDLTANWQILHLPSGLCVTAQQASEKKTDGDASANDSTSVSLTMERCRHDYLPQQFRHQYTLIRNGGLYPLTNLLGDLCATRDGKVSLSSSSLEEEESGFSSGPAASCGGSKDSFFAKWALYPNTHQLRNSFGYQPWLGGRAQCLQAISREEKIASDQ